MHECEPADWPLRGCEPGWVGPASLQLDPQSFGYPIDVVEVGHDLVQVDDIAVAESGGTQRSKVRFDHVLRRPGQFDGVSSQRAQALGELLQGKSFQQILDDVNSTNPGQIGQAVDAEADGITAIICKTDAAQPPSVCGQVGIQALTKQAP